MATFLLISAALLLIFMLAYTQSKSIRFFTKLIAYAICMVIACFFSFFLCLFNGRTPNNHYVMFKAFQIAVSWMNIRISIDKVNSELLETDEPYVMIANHQAALDVFTMTHVWPKNCVVVLKSSLKYLPGFNLCTYLACAIYINRFDRTRAHQSIGDAEAAIIHKKRKVFIYPEGTRNTGADLLPFKKGAFVIANNANVPIVPCVFSSYKPFYDFDERRFGAGDVRIRVLPKIYPAGKTVEELSDECRAVMLKALKEISDDTTSKKVN